MDADKLHKLNEFNIDKLTKKGFMFPSDEDITAIKEEDKMFPTQISDMTNEEILNKMAMFSALYSSAVVNEALAMTEVVGLERELEVNKSRIMQLSSSSKVTDKRLEASANKDVIVLQENLTIAESRQRLLTALKNSYETYYKMFSRVLTSMLEERKVF